MVAYVYTTIIIVAIILVLFRMIKKKQKTPHQYKTDENTPISYTPYDDITMGTQPDVKRDTPIKDTKHHIDYAENTDPKK